MRSRGKKTGQVSLRKLWGTYVFNYLQLTMQSLSGVQSLAAIVFMALIDVTFCSWTQNLSLPLSEKPTDLVEAIYSM